MPSLLLNLNGGAGRSGLWRSARGFIWPACLAVWLLLRVGGDRWWFPTVILFGPRWLCALPLAVLAPAAGLIRRRLLWVLGAAAMVVFGPVMGFCFPWARLAAAPGPSLRVLTCNVKGHCRNNQALEELIQPRQPDIVALQGCWGPFQVDWPAGWHVWQEGALVVASRYPLRHDGADHRWQRPGHWPRTDMLHCTVESPGRDIDFYSVHLQSPHDGLSAVLDRKTVLRPSYSVALAAEIDQRWRESEDAQGSVADCPSRWCWRAILICRPTAPSIAAIGPATAMRFPRPAWDSATRNGRGSQSLLRHQDRSRSDGLRLALPPLLGRAGRGLRPSSPAGRTLAPSHELKSHDNRNSGAGWR